MRYAKLAFALLGLAAVLIAADPFAGTWKLNLEKSKYKTGSPPKEQTATIAGSVPQNGAYQGLCWRSRR